MNIDRVYKRNTNWVIMSVLLLCGAGWGLAQESSLYVPLEYRNAVANGTRSWGGRPGERYWQNHSRYAITAEIDTAAHVLTGSETIVYHNNSPDTLEQVIIRLYQDIHRMGNPRDIDLPRADITDGVNIARIAVNGTPLTNIEELDRYGTLLYLPLPDKLSPGDSLGLSFDWSYRLSNEFLLRGSGKFRDNTYFISYWYPQVAVYDDITGWDEYEYKGLAEFYNDFSDYDVRITVPKEFVVWSTGVLQNPGEVLAPPTLARYEQAITSDEITAVITAEDRQKGGVTAQRAQNTWHYRAENVPDFAFGACDDYVWDLTSLVVDTQTQRRVRVGTAYDPGSGQLSRATELGVTTVDHLSRSLPGVPYPFPAMTIFQGTSEMEYPMMVNIRAYPDRREWLFISTLMHEVTHSWFPFYMGTNERKYAFMDEGWAHMLPMELQTEEIRKLREDFDARVMNNIWNYESSAGTENYDRPPAVLTVDANFYNYHVANHNRPGTAYYFLQDLLGAEVFKKALQEYMSRWHHKHPVPLDFLHTFNEVTGEDLGWYWKPWLYEFGYPDLAVREVRKNRSVVIEKVGTIPVPVRLLVTFEDESQVEVVRTARLWSEGNKTAVIKVPGRKPIKSVELGDRFIPDINRADNLYPRP